MKFIYAGAVCALIFLVAPVHTWAFPPYLTEWESQYPTSTLPARMAASVGETCNLCHHPPSKTTAGNCYRTAIVTLLGQGLNIADAITQLDSEDSDGDGVANGVEILMAYAESAGDVGYNPGLAGATGTDPCAGNVNEVVTGQSETPAGPVPAISTWGVVMMTLLLLTGATGVLRYRDRWRRVQVHR